MRKRFIFIAKNHHGDIIGIVLAEAPEIAHAYFVGRDQIPHTTQQIDPDNQDLGVMGLVILLKTTERTFRNDRSLPVDIVVQER
jgi:hypothetical protein